MKPIFYHHIDVNCPRSKYNSTPWLINVLFFITWILTQSKEVMITMASNAEPAQPNDMIQFLDYCDRDYDCSL